MDSCREDVPSLAHWWSNCLHLRWMLWAMCRGGGDGGNNMEEFSLVTKVRFNPSPSLCSFTRLLICAHTSPMHEQPASGQGRVAASSFKIRTPLTSTESWSRNNAAYFFALHTAPVLIICCCTAVSMTAKYRS